MRRRRWCSSLSTRSSSVSTTSSPSNCWMWSVWCCTTQTPSPSATSSTQRSPSCRECLLHGFSFNETHYRLKFVLSKSISYYLLGLFIFIGYHGLWSIYYLLRQVIIVLNIFCKFSEDMFDQFRVVLIVAAFVNNSNLPHDMQKMFTNVSNHSIGNSTLYGATFYEYWLIKSYIFL